MSWESTVFTHLVNFKPINTGDYWIWWILPSRHIDCYSNWLRLVIFSNSLLKPMCVECCLIWWYFFAPSQISQFKSLPNIDRFTLLSFYLEFLSWALTLIAVIIYSCSFIVLDMQNLVNIIWHTSLAVRRRYIDDPIYPAWPEDGIIQFVRPVSGCHKQHRLIVYSSYCLLTFLEHSKNYTYTVYTNIQLHFRL